MIDYEEMNRVLGQADREFAVQKRKDFTEETLPDGWTPEQSYAACMESLRRTKEYIERIQTGVREEYDEVVAGDDSANKELVGAVYGLALHTIAFPLISWLFIFNHILIAVLCGVLAIFWAFATISFAKRVLNAFTTHRVMKSKPGTEEYAREFRIPTYGARRSQCENRLKLVQDRLTRLDTYERQIERQQGLSNADYESMLSLREIPKSTETFSDKKEVTFREFREWKSKRKK
ncbi:MAG: hypothetical protein IKZ69_05605 [Lachnospiraceae bacterium]|nr:hypothetical protein [Lachnospiraceae bacterium]